MPDYQFKYTISAQAILERYYNSSVNNSTLNRNVLKKYILLLLDLTHDPNAREHWQQTHYGLFIGRVNLSLGDRKKITILTQAQAIWPGKVDVFITLSEFKGVVVWMKETMKLMRNFPETYQFQLDERLRNGSSLLKSPYLLKLLNKSRCTKKERRLGKVFAITDNALLLYTHLHFINEDKVLRRPLISSNFCVCHRFVFGKASFLRRDHT
ncbi:hypothetical protein TNCT_209781 [Trichonephila clavata]|uniref:Uncharacterized protein n=1 Tax=Trichonephila clavata TaxID=2740835 RepID=A0A8X6KQD0_TRICU|nr:hypothetical protein TNCT_209781 [Trichonephila clavata]